MSVQWSSYSHSCWFAQWYPRLWGQGGFELPWSVINVCCLSIQSTGVSKALIRIIFKEQRNVFVSEWNVGFSKRLCAQDVPETLLGSAGWKQGGFIWFNSGICAGLGGSFVLEFWLKLRKRRKCKDSWMGRRALTWLDGRCRLVGSTTWKAADGETRPPLKLIGSVSVSPAARRLLLMALIITFGLVLFSAFVPQLFVFSYISFWWEKV